MPRSTTTKKKNATRLASTKIQVKSSGSKANLPALKTSPALPAEISGESSALQIYLREVQKYPLLSREQEFEYAKKYYETKDPEIAQILVTSNLRFVVKVAMEYSKFGAKMIDVIQEGNIGLMQAVKEFNPYKGVRLITYAVWWIKGYIQEYLMRQYSMVRIGTNQKQKRLFYQLQKSEAEIDKQISNDEVQLLSSRYGVDEKKVESMAQRVSQRDVSLEASLSDDTDRSLMDYQSNEEAGPDEVLALKEGLALVESAVTEIRPKLNEKELFLLDERILADPPRTLQEIGDHFGITREAVRQIETRLLAKIREIALPNQN
jgi:RNA polymerase sigma-32 factor